jgi:hypothetical protein
VQYRMIAIAFVVVAGVAACAQAQTTPLRAARLTIDGATHTTRPSACSQLQSYRTIDIRDREARWKPWCCSVATGPSLSG